MLRRLKNEKPLRRVAFGGARSPELVLVLSYAGVALKPKGSRRNGEVRITWNQLYKLVRDARNPTTGP